jgi:hypothetical protein
VSCDFPLTVRLILSNAEGYIPLDLSTTFRSNISINDENVGGKGVLVRAVQGIGTLVNITSTLSHYSNKMGDFNGAAVLVVAVE